MTTEDLIKELWNRMGDRIFDPEPIYDPVFENVDEDTFHDAFEALNNLQLKYSLAKAKGDLK
jgi:hypothetical protein